MTDDEMCGITEWLVEKLREMSCEERVEVFADIEQNFCIYCGTDEPLCHCQKDK